MKLGLEGLSIGAGGSAVKAAEEVGAVLNSAEEVTESLSSEERKISTKLKQEIADFQQKAQKGELPSVLRHLNLENFDQDKNGLDRFEEERYKAALNQAVEQIISLDSLEAFIKIQSDAQNKSWSSFDKKAADLIDLQGYIGDEKGDELLGEQSLNKLNLSSTELNEMAERKFNPTSKKSWQELGVLLSKEIGDGAEMVLRFMGNAPAGVILIPRYLKYRVENNSSNKKIVTKVQIKLQHLIEDNPSLMLPQLLGEQGVELLKELGRMSVSGKQGDIAVVLTSVAGLIAGGAGAVKFGAKLGKMEKLAQKAGKVQNVTEKIDSATVAGIDRLPGVVLKNVNELAGGRGREIGDKNTEKRNPLLQEQLNNEIFQDIKRSRERLDRETRGRIEDEMERGALRRIRESGERKKFWDKHKENLPEWVLDQENVSKINAILEHIEGEDM
ncbi:MAG TPA: hypothetical protein GX706_04075 [Candidatus Moranbacteria bacterium]|nr:hypothetical protein [Candidatus Moranbacteria bacterium]